MASGKSSGGGYEAKRAARQKRFDTRLQWYADKVAKGVKVGIGSRLRFSGQLLRDQVVINLSRPVRKIRGRADPASRSKPGEFPRADTTRLMKDIFWKETEKDVEVQVGTTLDYGLFLETRMDRSFLLRTMNEMRDKLTAILAAPGSDDMVVFNEHPDP